MLRALIISLALGQIYEWVDSKGESHFTDDVSTIPKGVKRRTTEGTAPVVETQAAPKPAPSLAQPNMQKPAAPDRCVVAKARVVELERELEAAKVAEAQAAQTPSDCQALLRTQGQSAYARCIRFPAKPLAKSSPAQSPRIENQLEGAREELRRAQVDGC
jgi:hypothetical protein